ncbi:MAG: FecCD family ABC transporter permease [Bacillota bacterium]
MENVSVLEQYKKNIYYKILFGFSAAILLFGAGLYALAVGSYTLPVTEVLNILLLRELDSTAHHVIWNIRVPRILTAIIAGAGLSIAGAAMQSILRNPLGSPFTLGISSAAAFGAAVALGFLGAGTMTSSAAEASIMINNPYLVTICAFLSSLIATTVILILAQFKGATPETMILTGVALGSLFTAGTTFIQYFSDQVRIAAIVFWTFGDVGKANWNALALISAVTLFAIVYFLLNSWNYNTLKAGDETAKSLGVNVDRIRITGMLLSSFLTAVTVSFIGIIGFVGLVIPHIVRRFIGGNEIYLLPLSALTGGLLLLGADTVARTIIAPVVLPVGILTSFMGAPLFIYLVIKGRNYW